MNKSIASYARVSTQDQNLARQRKANTEHIQSNFDAELGDINSSNKSTETNTNRDETTNGRRKNGSIDVVVIKDLI